MKTAAVLLAAGSSSRLGSPKQLVLYQGVSLLRRAAVALLEAGCVPVAVVLGARAPDCETELKDLSVHPVVNPLWSEGMASSIRAGVNEVTRLAPDLDAVLIAVCDQPLVTASHLRALMDLYRAGACKIAAAEYGTVLGVPAVFGRDLFGSLAELEGDAGARRLIQSHGPAVARFPLQSAALDVDRPEDLATL